MFRIFTGYKNLEFNFWRDQRYTFLIHFVVVKRRRFTTFHNNFTTQCRCEIVYKTIFWPREWMISLIARANGLFKVCLRHISLNFRQDKFCIFVRALIKSLILISFRVSRITNVFSPFTSFVNKDNICQELCASKLKIIFVIFVIIVTC